MSKVTVRPPALSDALSLGPIDGRILDEITRAERLAESLLPEHGLLLDDSGRSDTDKYSAIIQRQLSREDRVAYEQFTDVAAAVRVVVNGEDDNAADAANNAYTPLIDGAYCLGLAMGFAAAQMIGGRR